MWPLLRDFWTDRVAARTTILAVIAFFVAFFTIDDSLGLGARIAFAAGQTFLVGTASLSPSGGSGKLDGISRIGMVFLVLIFVACAGAQTPAQRWYVAKEHYITTSTTVNALCAQPTTPLNACQRADAVMDEAEREITAFEGEALTAGPTRYEKAIAILEHVREELLRLLPAAKQ